MVEKSDGEPSSGEKIEQNLSLRLNANSFWDRLVQRAAYHEAHYIDIIGAYASLGVKMLQLDEGDSYRLRNKAGYEKNLDLMDNQFSYDPNALRIGTQQRTIPVIYHSSVRELVTNAATQRRIDVAQLSARIVLLCLHAMEQKDNHDDRLLEYKDRKSSPYEFGIPRPNVPRVKNHLRTLFGSQEQNLLEMPKNQDET